MGTSILSQQVDQLSKHVIYFQLTALVSKLTTFPQDCAGNMTLHYAKPSAFRDLKYARVGAPEVMTLAYLYALLFKITLLHQRDPN